MVTVSTQLLKSACGKRPSTAEERASSQPTPELSKQFLEGNIRPGQSEMGVEGWKKHETENSEIWSGTE